MLESEFKHTPKFGAPGHTYVFRRPSFNEKTFAFRRAVTVAGGVWHGDDQMMAALEAGVRSLLSDPGDAEIRAAWEARIPAYRQAERAWRDFQAEEAKAVTVLPPKTPEEMSAEEIAAAEEKRARVVALAEAYGETWSTLQEVHELVRRGDPRYAGMAADREALFAIRGSVAIDMFLVRLEIEADSDLASREGAARDLAPREGAAPAAGDAVPRARVLHRRKGPLPAELAAAIDGPHVESIGLWCSALFEPGDAQRKNSASRSPSSTTAKTSPATSTSLN